MGLELGLALLAEQGWPQRLSADGGKARGMLAVLTMNLGTLSLALLPSLPQRHNSTLFAITCRGKLDKRTALFGLSLLAAVHPKPP
jgi:hypothetical protein